jgi:transposase-like protein
MDKCIKTVVDKSCHYCLGPTIKFGKTGYQQRYRCKDYKKTQLANYTNRAYGLYKNSYIIGHVTVF